MNYVRNGKSGLALITDRDGKRNWSATDVRCVPYFTLAAACAYVEPHFFLTLPTRGLSLAQVGCALL